MGCVVVVAPPLVRASDQTDSRNSQTVDTTTEASATTERKPSNDVDEETVPRSSSNTSEETESIKSAEATPARQAAEATEPEAEFEPVQPSPTREEAPVGLAPAPVVQSPAAAADGFKNGASPVSAGVQPMTPDGEVRAGAALAGPLSIIGTSMCALGWGAGGSAVSAAGAIGDELDSGFGLAAHAQTQFCGIPIVGAELELGVGRQGRAARGVGGGIWLVPISLATIARAPIKGWFGPAAEDWPRPYARFGAGLSMLAADVVSAGTAEASMRRDVDPILHWGLGAEYDLSRGLGLDALHVRLELRHTIYLEKVIGQFIELHIGFVVRQDGPLRGKSPTPP